MKIAHIGLASFYTDGMSYQDNQLAEQNVRDGHEVLYISNAAKYVGGKLVETGFEDTVLPCGVRLVRLPYVKLLSRSLSDKIRKVSGLYKLLNEFSPDVILCHSAAFISMSDVVRYMKEHRTAKLYIDTHTDKYNSASNWLSLHLLHRGLYRYAAQKALPYVEKLLYISVECRDFFTENYGYPIEKAEFYPLGGRIPDDMEYNARRISKRRELNIADDELMFIHSGKLAAPKKTEELLRAFAAVPELKARIVIVGFIPDDMKDTLEPLIDRDSRVIFLGWKSADELFEYLCGADMYVQPGSESATMETSMCCRCAQLLYPSPSYLEEYPNDMAFWVRSEEEIVKAFHDIAQGKASPDRMRKAAYKFAKEMLDYKMLAARLYL